MQCKLFFLLQNEKKRVAKPSANVKQLLMKGKAVEKKKVRRCSSTLVHL